MASKSDTLAKKAYIEELRKQGFEPKVKAEPADIVATKNGETWYFEIKMTSRTNTYFGAATLTEWEQAFKTPNHYFFVIAIKKEDDKFEFRKFTPLEFMKYSTIPPFKVYFNLPSMARRKPPSAAARNPQSR